MNAEDLTFDYCSNTEVIENFSAIFPWVGVSVLSNGLIVETIHGSNLSSLVISSKEGDVGWVLKLETKQELEGLNRVEPSVYKVSHENVSGFWNLTALVEELQKIMELSMDISTDGYWSFNWLHIAFFNQDFLDFLTENS